jgi:hypothetical protein
MIMQQERHATLVIADRAQLDRRERKLEGTRQMLRCRRLRSVQVRRLQENAGQVGGQVGFPACVDLDGQ